MGTIGSIIRDLLLIDLITQLVGGVLRLTVVVVIVVVLLQGLGGLCLGGVCIPRIVNLEDAFIGVLQATGQVPLREPECQQFSDAFPQFLPDTWLLRHVETINIDGDNEKECLAVYQYNAGNGPYGGLLGGVVYDPQPDRDPHNMETAVPYRPAAYVPYELLPRDDGAGFLSERAGDWSQMIQVYDADGDTLNELVFQGYSGYGFPTYMSVFKWQNKKDGYRIMTRPQTDETAGGPLWGDAGMFVRRESLQDEDGNEVVGPIEGVTLKTRSLEPFWYFRSQLCYANIYRWNAARTALEQQDYYLTFCFGRPNGVPTRQDEYFLRYPEEALLAWYEDGEVREIDFSTAPVGDTVEATVTLRQSGQQQWLATWKLRRNTDGRAGNMTFWYLEQMGEPPNQ